MNPERMLNDTQIARLADDLRGTPDSLDGTLERLYSLGENDLTTDDCVALDELVFCCDQCGWWDTIDQMGDAIDMVCLECLEC